jgi:SRSO17 transposase
MQATRKNMERMEEHVVGADDQALQYMLTDAQWDSKAVMDQVAQEVNQLLGGDESCLLLDESGFEKKGEHSVGVARQWNGRLGKVDNCQVGVFAALGCGTRVSLIDFRLYLPESWSKDALRCKKMGNHFIPSKPNQNWPWKWSDTNANRASSLPGWVLMAVTEKNRLFCGDWMIWMKSLWWMFIKIN